MDGTHQVGSAPPRLTWSCEEGPEAKAHGRTAVQTNLRSRHASCISYSGGLQLLRCGRAAGGPRLLPDTGSVASWKSGTCG